MGVKEWFSAFTGASGRHRGFFERVRDMFGN